MTPMPAKLTHDIKPPKAIYFDWDGTLADSYGLLEAAHNHARQSLGRPAFEAGEFENYFGKPRDVLYPLLYGDDEDQARIAFEGFVYENHKTLLAPLDHAHEVLKYLKTQDVIIGIVSNKKPSLIAEEIKVFGWHDYFSCLVGSNDAKADKPSAAPLVLAMDKSAPNISVQDVWLIGDTTADLGCALNAGCYSVYIGSKNLSEDEINHYSPLHIANNCKDLLDFCCNVFQNR